MFNSMIKTPVLDYCIQLKTTGLGLSCGPSVFLFVVEGIVM